MERATPETRRIGARRSPSFETVATLASRLGVTRVSVFRSRARLVDAGLVVVVPMTRDNGCGRNAASAVVARDVFEIDFGSDIERVKSYVVARKRAWRSWVGTYPRAVDVGDDPFTFDPSAMTFVPPERARWRNDRHARALPHRSHQPKRTTTTQKPPGSAGGGANGANRDQLAGLRGNRTPPERVPDRCLGGLHDNLEAHRRARARLSEAERARLIVEEIRTMGLDRALRNEMLCEALGAPRSVGRPVSRYEPR